MKKIGPISTVLLISCLLLAACSSQATTSTTTASLPAQTKASSQTMPLATDPTNSQAIDEPEAYTFIYKNQKLTIGAEAEPILAELGEPINYFEAPSCAFQGMDKIYTYPGLEITTYNDESDEDFIYSVSLIDDTVATPENIMLGLAAEDVKNAYGNDYTESLNQLLYRQGNTDLKFIFADDELVSIEYFLVTD